MSDYDDIADGSDSSSEQAEREAQKLGSHQESLMAVRVRYEKQVVWLRWLSYGLVLIVVCAAVCLEYVVLVHLLNLQVDAPLTNLFVVLAISPIISVTVITIFALVSVFRGFRSSDMRNLPTETASRFVTGSSE